MCAIAGVDCQTLDNSASYIRSWIKRLKDDPRLFFDAARAASKAVDYWRHGKSKETEEGDTTEEDFAPEERTFTVAPTRAPKAAEVIRQEPTRVTASAKAAPEMEQMTLF